MDSSSNSTLFSSILFLSPANAATIVNMLSHLNFLLFLFITSVFPIFTKFKSKTITKSKPMLVPPGPAPWPLLRNLPHLTRSQLSVGYMALWKKWTLKLHVFNRAIFMSSHWLPQRLAENFWRNMMQYLHPGPWQWRLSIQVVASWPQQWCHGETSGRRWEGFSLLMWLIHQHLGGYMTREWKKRTILFDAFITSVRSLLAITALAQLSTWEIQSVNTAEMPSGRWSSTQDTLANERKMEALELKRNSMLNPSLLYLLIYMYSLYLITSHGWECWT